ncbi:MAG: hypothetical protein ACREDI_04585 [Roseiarcus sp.]
MLAQFAETQDDLKLVLKTVRDMVDVMHLMYDDIYSHLRKIEPARR